MLLFPQDKTTEMTADLHTQGVEIRTDDGWLRVAQATPSTRASAGDLDAPAPWKWCGRQRLFEVPLTIVSHWDSGESDVDDDPEAGLVATLAEWAMQTIDGGVPQGWSSPPVDRLNELVPAATLSFRSGSFIEAARLVADDRTLRVQVTLGRLDPILTATRRKWAEQLVAATRHLRMVRVGIRDGEAGNSTVGGAIEAAVDLTGAPASVAEALLPAAVQALRHCFVFFVTTATLIGDAGCLSRVLDAAPSRNTNSTRSRKT